MGSADNSGLIVVVRGVFSRYSSYNQGMNTDSPIVEEVRKRRCELSERFGHDLCAYYEHLQQVQAKYQSRIVDQVTVVRSCGTANQRETNHGVDTSQLNPNQTSCRGVRECPKPSP